MTWELDASGLAAAYRAGRADPVEVLAEYRARIARIDPLLNAYVAANPAAVAEAEASRRRWRSGAPVGPLDGVPLAVKDNMVAAGMPATWGSRVFAGVPCEADELPVRRLRAAGAVILGKTNTPEFAVEGYTGNALFGVTGNPWNPTLTPGGSSGGTVAAVAAGLAAAGIGTDGGGSIRRPAAYTGLFGLKPGIGTCARGGGLPQVLLDFEVVGPLARSARDLRLIHGVLAGADRTDPRSRLRAEAANPCGPLRILYVERLGAAPLDPGIAASVSAAAARLERLGHRVEPGALPFDLAELTAGWGRIAQIGLARMRREIPAMAGLAGPKYLAMADDGEAITAQELLAILQAVDRLRAAVSRFFGEWDAILTPSCAAQPWPAGESHPETIDGQPVGPRGHAIYTGWVNAAGHPAVAIPCDPDATGMPVGFQIIGDLGAEAMLIDLAEACEAAAGGWTRWPDVARG